MVFPKQSSKDFLSTLDIPTSNLLVEDLVRFNPRILIQAEWKLTVFFPWGNWEIKAFKSYSQTTIINKKHRGPPQVP